MTFMGGPELSIVIPVYNEEAVLPALVARLRTFMERLAPLEAEVIWPTTIRPTGLQNC